jgi:hypothetical protein
MKTRNGFVSNSSSSSFILQLKEPTFCPHCGRRDADIIGLINKLHCNNDDNQVLAENKEQAIEYIKNSWFVDSFDLEKLKSFKNEEIIIVSISIHDEFLNQEVRKGKYNIIYEN